MSKPLTIQCFEQGARRGLMKAAGHTKSAIDPRAVRIMLDPLRKKELSALGERLFREAMKPQTPWQGLKSVILPGFGQMQSLKHLIASYPSLYRNAAAADRPMMKKMFQQQLQQAFAEMGHVAEPKLKFWRTTAPAAAGGTVGMGLGLGAGSVSGSIQRQRDVEQRLADMPLWDRMRYLVLPQSLNVRPQLPYELRSTQT